VSSGTTTFTYDLAGNRAGTGHTTTLANRATAVPGYTLAYDDGGELSGAVVGVTGDALGVGFADESSEGVVGVGVAGQGGAAGDLVGQGGETIQLSAHVSQFAG
jgi:hypothetical protein